MHRKSAHEALSRPPPPAPRPRRLRLLLLFPGSDPTPPHLDATDEAVRLAAFPRPRDPAPAAPGPPRDLADGST